MAGILLQICVFVFLSNSNSVLSHLSDEFFFDRFNGLNTTTNISLNGAAEIENKGMIRLTNHTNHMLGHAFYQSPIKFKNATNGKALSFSTAFAVAIVTDHPVKVGHGMAFTISRTKDLVGAQPGLYLGLLNATNNGDFSNHVFAVEFDTVQDHEFEDVDGNHVGININSLKSDVSTSAAYFVNSSRTNATNKKALDLKTGKKIQVWIDYESTENELIVRLSPYSEKPKSSILSLNVDLSPILEEFMYIGFSGSTGRIHCSSHYVLGWSFSMNGEAKSLSLSSLPTPPEPRKKKSKTTFTVSVSVSAASVLVLVIATTLYFGRKIMKADVIEDWELDVGPHRFSYQELKRATKGFRDKELLGFGGFGRVYKGTLENSDTQVAVKQISHESKQGLREFLSEIASIGRLRHKNIVQLLGWCRHQGDLLLVYDFMPNGSLDKYIFDKPEKILTWEQRLNIIKGVASGLLYLHEEWEQTVIHRDIKAGNVLLDSELNGRLGDFGLAKLYEHGSNPSTTRVVGTLGYLAPEVARTGKPRKCSDVFAFGALLLEVVCGRRPIEPKALPDEIILVDWVWRKWKEGAILDVVDKGLSGEYDEIEVTLALKLGLICSHNMPGERPSMRLVVRYLEGDVALLGELTPLAGAEFGEHLHSSRTSSVFEKISTRLDEEAEMPLFSTVAIKGSDNDSTGVCQVECTEPNER